MTITVPVSAVGADSLGLTDDQKRQQTVSELRLRAVQGDRDAQFSLATAYDSAYGVQRDLRRAAFWYQRAAELGHETAQFNLAVLLEGGEPSSAPRPAAHGEASGEPTAVPMDLEAARFWYRKAADHGSADAANNLGLLYASQKLADPTYQAARSWFSIAAENGSQDAAFNLGRLHELGLGVVADRESAAEWYRRAGSHHAAAEALKRLSD